MGYKTHILYIKIVYCLYCWHNARFIIMAKNEIKLLLAGWCRKLPLHQPFSDVEHSHEFWQIDLCEKGDAQLKVGDSRFQISAGDIVIISPGLPHRFQYPQGREFTCWSFKFDTAESAAPQIVPVCDDESRKERKAIIESVALMCRAFFPEKLLNSHMNFAVSGTIPSVSILESFISGIVRRWFFERDDKSDTLAYEITQYVYRKGGAAVTVEEIAEHLGYSAGYLRILARQKCGEATKTLIDRARIRVAKKLLLYSDMRINELSDTMGFADWKYFSRFFRKYTGMSPREYIRSKS